MFGEVSIVLLSGEIASGKTSTAKALIERHGFSRIQTGVFLQEVADERGQKTDRHALQDLGDVLDKETKGDWVAKLAASQIADSPEVLFWVLDSVRRDFQIERFRECFGKCVLHVHLGAQNEVLKDRYQSRQKTDTRDARASYARAKENVTERHAANLGEVSDLRINTASISAHASAAAIAATIQNIT